MTRQDSNTLSRVGVLVLLCACIVLVIILLLLTYSQEQLKPAFSESGKFQLTQQDIEQQLSLYKWKMPSPQITSTQQFLDYIENPPATCHSSVIIGGRKCHEYDEHLVCLENSLLWNHEDCLVYSFGAGSGSFESGMNKLGCHVYTFDPFMSSRTDRRVNDRSWLMAVRLEGNNSAALPGDRIMSLPELRRTLGHRGRQVDYMRLDIDGDEWPSLRQMLAHSPLALADVRQLGVQAGLEVSHLPARQRLQRLQELYQVLLALEYNGLRLVSSRPQGDHHQHCHQLPDGELAASRRLCDYVDLLFVRKFPSKK